MKRTPLRKVSKKYAPELRAYQKERKIFLEDKFCEYPEGCVERADDVHHSQGRGINLRKQSTWWALCRTHHDFVHQNPNIARTMGLLK